MRARTILLRAAGICTAATLTAVAGSAGVAGYGVRAATRASSVSPPHSTRSEQTRGPGAAELASDSWRVLARSPIGAPAGASVTWDGTELLVVGGADPGGQERVRRTAAAFDPSTGRWRMIAPVPSVVLPAGAAAVWTGSKLFVFGGSEPPGPPPTGIAGLYDPTSNTWTLTPPAPIRLPSEGVAAALSGDQVILAAIGGSYPHLALQVVEYDSSSGRWSSLPLRVPAGHIPVDVEIVATNRGVLLWSLWSRTHVNSPHSLTVYSGLDVFRLIGGAWRHVGRTWPQDRTVDQPLFTGSRILLGANQIWCGFCEPPLLIGTNGWSVNPATLRITKLPHGPIDDLRPQILWAGAAEIELNTGGEITGSRRPVQPGDIAFLDLVSRRWYRGPRAPRRLGQLPAVWDGSHLLVLARRGELLSYGAQVVRAGGRRARERSTAATDRMSRATIVRRGWGRR